VAQALRAVIPRNAEEVTISVLKKDQARFHKTERGRFALA
jgi:hypothetical protein